MTEYPLILGDWQCNDVRGPVRPPQDAKVHPKQWHGVGEGEIAFLVTHPGGTRILLQYRMPPGRWVGGPPWLLSPRLADSVLRVDGCQVVIRFVAWTDRWVWTYDFDSEEAVSPDTPLFVEG